MANYVKVSCLSAPKCPVNADAGFDQAASRLIAHWERQLEQVLPDQPDIIVLPEACDTPGGIGNRSEWLEGYYRQRGNRIRDYFGTVSRDHRCYIAYSAWIHVPEDDSLRNATQLIDRTGQVCGTYNKNFLTMNEKADSSALYGKEARVFEADFGRVGCAICYDLNFDEVREQYVRLKPDLIIFSSAYHGGLMQQYWAYSCQAYFAGSVFVENPCSIVSPVGHIMAESTNYYHYVTHTINLDRAVIHIGPNGKRFKDMKRKYGPKIGIFDPGRIGSVLLTSETDEFTVDEIIKEFNLQQLDDKWTESRVNRLRPGYMEE
jgi:predicted amidohydrolase